MRKSLRQQRGSQAAALSAYRHNDTSRIQASIECNKQLSAWTMADAQCVSSAPAPVQRIRDFVTVTVTDVSRPVYAVTRDIFNTFTRII